MSARAIEYLECCVVLRLTSALLLALALVSTMGCGGTPTNTRTPALTALPTAFSTVQPPDWFIAYVRRELRSLGDPEGSVWWTRTTASRSVPSDIDNEAGSPSGSDSQRSVYEVVFHGHFVGNDHISYSLAEGSPSSFSWGLEILDAASRHFDLGGAGDTSFPIDSLQMHRLRL